MNIHVLKASRRNFLWSTAAFAASTALLRAQQPRSAAARAAGRPVRRSVVIAESSAGYTTEGFNNFGYVKVAAEHKPLGVSLVDLNEEGKQIEIRGARLAEVTRKYEMHRDLERELRWMGPMKEVPEKLG